MQSLLAQGSIVPPPKDREQSNTENLSDTLIAHTKIFWKVNRVERKLWNTFWVVHWELEIKDNISNILRDIWSDNPGVIDTFQNTKPVSIKSVLEKVKWDKYLLSVFCSNICPVNQFFLKLRHFKHSVRKIAHFQCANVPANYLQKGRVWLPDDGKQFKFEKKTSRERLMPTPRAKLKISRGVRLNPREVKSRFCLIKKIVETFWKKNGKCGRGTFWYETYCLRKSSVEKILVYAYSKKFRSY